MEIRRLRAEEGMRLRSLRLRALLDAPDAFATAHADAAARPDSSWHEWAASAASGAGRCTFVAISSDGWQGMLSAVADRTAGTAELIQMWVAPAVRGTGVGKRLIDAVCNWGADAGLTSLQLWVSEGNTPAIALYVRTGFAIAGERRDSSSQHGVTVQMSKALPANGDTA